MITVAIVFVLGLVPGIYALWSSRRLTRRLDDVLDWSRNVLAAAKMRPGGDETRVTLYTLTP